VCYVDRAIKDTSSDSVVSLKEALRSKTPNSIEKKEAPMTLTLPISWLAAAALAFTALNSSAQTTPRIKAGLWQIQAEREENGVKMPDASERMKERMKNMTPERRKQFEESMKQRGVDPNAGGVIKVCYSQKMVEHGAWADQGTCKTDYSNRTATHWKWHSVCPEVHYEGDGEASFPDPEDFVVKSSGVLTSGDKTRNIKSTRTAKWISADCGDVKPLDSQQ
jgi:hypothetical protein